MLHRNVGHLPVRKACQSLYSDEGEETKHEQRLAESREAYQCHGDQVFLAGV